MWLINPSNGFTRDVSKTIATSNMNVFVVLLVCSLQPSTNVTKNSVLGVAEDPPLELFSNYVKLQNCCTYSFSDHITIIVSHIQ